MNDLSEFSTTAFEGNSRKFNFKVKMGVPFCPSHAPVEITQTMLEENREGGSIICENSHKTDYPYADIFDIVHRYEFIKTGETKSRMKFYSRQEWRKKVPFVRGALDALVNHKQGTFVKNVSKVVKKYTNEEIKSLLLKLRE
ncbi:Oidioi.mRNA.OKI2018_I69.PAR.g9145.t1.cds [Oikopleura dioica]|uniref:Oidioi.mRNA.OKI2018_I69.PAR.g9145.t1.cds n=1 Tax=Oikopleura dioica TaxID=34765 RepID=A0ABN7RJA1_OIKDI|nr:Oidioi.mRNA.OKI2018_I69.PAR.g9145.t1.cds [Oikopleura dioica]